MRSFQAERALVQVERALPGSSDLEVESWEAAEDRLRAAVLHSFQTEPAVVQAERLLHGWLDVEMQARFRQATAHSLDAGTILADAERAAWQAIDPESLAEVRSRVDAHLAGPLAIPDQDLAVYVPTDDAILQQTQQALIEPLEEIGRLIEEEVEIDGEAELGLPMVRWPPALPSAAPPTEEREMDAPSRPPTELDLPDPEDRVQELELAKAATRAAIEVEPSLEQTQAVDGWSLERSLELHQRTPLLLVTAALEAIGLDEEEFGFLHRYGTYAPIGKKSQIKVSGLPLADFSRRAAEWFNALGATKFPIQVVDTGSGELTVYLLEAPPA